MNGLLASLLLLSSLQALPGRAHQIESALQYLDGDLELSSQFSNGEPTEGAVVRLLDADGNAERSSDAPMPMAVCALTSVISTMAWSIFRSMADLGIATTWHCRWKRVRFNSRMWFRFR